MSQILILANNDIGLYKFRKELLQELIRLNYKVVISLPKGEYVESLIEMGCEYIDTPIDRRGTNPITDLNLLSYYRKIIKKIKPDIVLTYTIKPNIYGGLVCRFTKTTYMANITGLGTAVENKGILQKMILFLYSLSLKKAHCVFFQNEENKNYFVNHKIVKENIKQIPGSGVNLNDYTYLEYPDCQTGIKFIFIGRIMKDKGVDELLSAAKKVKEKYHNIQFELIGECEENYSNILKEYEKNGIIIYHGRINNIRPFIKESHATILPSYHEGLANVLLESAASGRPILATNVSGCRETYDEGISGFGFKARNVEDLTETIINFIELPYEQKKEMGAAGRKKVENEFDRQIVIDAYINEISKILN